MSETYQVICVFSCILKHIYKTELNFSLMTQCHYHKHKNCMMIQLYPQQQLNSLGFFPPCWVQISRFAFFFSFCVFLQLFIAFFLNTVNFRAGRDLRDQPVQPTHFSEEKTFFLLHCRAVPPTFCYFNVSTVSNSSPFPNFLLLI